MISVVTPSYNQGAYIEETIQSVLNQNYHNFQHIIMDGGSTDSTLDILKRYSHLRWFSQKDRGQADALNQAIRKSSGEIIAWINSDDYYPPGVFEIVAKTFRANPGVHVIVGDCLELKQDSGATARLYNRELGFEEMLRYWDGRLPPHQPSVFFRSEVIHEFGEFDESFRYAMDYEYWLRISRKFRFFYVPEILSVYRFHPDSKSGTGADWTRFFPEWHRAYLKYKSESRLLPQRPMVTVALPANEGLAGEMTRLKNQRLQDLEILLIQKSTESNKPEIEDCPFPVKTAQVQQWKRDDFLNAVSNHATGFAVHFPVPEFQLPPLWYCDALTALLDHPERDEIHDESLRQISHPVLGTSPGPATLIRRATIQSHPRLFSIVIPTYNRSAALSRCLHALSEQSLPPDQYEVIVCDDGSTDNTRETMDTFSAPYQIRYLQQHNRGPAAARNLGLREARGKWVLILNDDSLPATDLLEAHRRAHESSPNDSFATLGSFPFHRDYRNDTFGDLIDKSQALFQYAGMNGNQFYDWRYFWTCNISIPSKLLESAGWFDEDFREPAGEDIDYGYRLSKLGCKVFYDPSCKAEHLHQISLISFCHRQISVGRNLVLLARKHPELTADLLGSGDLLTVLQKTRTWLSQNEPEVKKDFQSFLNPTPESRSLSHFNRLNGYFLRQGISNGFLRYLSAHSSENTVRITFVVPGLQISGGLRIVLEYCKRLAEKGAHITLVSLTPEPLQWFSLPQNVSLIFSGWNDERLNQDLPDADAIFATQWATAYFVARAAPSKGVNFYFIQSYESETLTTPEAADLTYLLPLHKIVVSHSLEEKLRRFDPSIEVIRNAIDTKIFYPDSQSRQNFPVNFRIGMLYHPEERKGCADGFEAVRLARKKHPSLKLIVFGSKPESKEIDEFHGSLTGEQLRKFYHSLDVFLSTSKQEGFGLPGLEALSCGTPLITTDSGGIREYAIHEENSLICEPEDPKALQAAIERLIENPELRERFQRNGPIQAANFDWETSINRMQEVVRTQIQEYSRSIRTGTYPVAAGRQTTVFYSDPAKAPFWKRVMWKLRDKSYTVPYARKLIRAIQR